MCTRLEKSIIKKTVTQMPIESAISDEEEKEDEEEESLDIEVSDDEEEESTNE